MDRETDQSPDLVADIVALAAEATLLDARARMIREELTAVSARIGELSDLLRQLPQPAVLTGPATGEDSGELGEGGATERRTGARGRSAVPRRADTDRTRHPVPCDPSTCARH